MIEKGTKNGRSRKIGKKESVPISGHAEIN